MSFGGGFGSSNNTGGGFSGFGSNNNTNTTSGASLFGGNTATAGGGFGGFGNNNAASNNPFGAAAKPGFGTQAATTGGGLFGAGASTTTGFGNSGFGANNNATGGATLGAGFGAQNTGSLFGAKPATTGFGSTNTAGGSLFGNNAGGGFGASSNTTTANPFGNTASTTSNPFGGNASTNTGAFGAANANTGFSAFGNTAAANATTQGTAATPFAPVTEKDGTATNATSAYQSITMQPPYQGKSFDELRLEDYAQNRRLPQNNSFGSSSTFSGFGQANNSNANQARPGLFGSTPSNTTAFGASNTGFGATNNTTTGTSLFGAKPAATGFGANASSGTSLFGGTTANTANTSTGFGTGFGQSNNAASSSLFGNNNNNANQAKPAFGGFGAQNPTTTSTGFNGFGNNSNNNTAAQPSQGLFGGSSSTAGAFGSNTSGGLFGAAKPAAPAAGGLFGNTPNTNTTGGGLFGSNNTQAPGAFGNSTGGGLFGGNNQATANTGTGLFGANNAAKPATTGLFGSAAPATGGGLFGASNNNNAGSSLFGNPNNQQNSSLFGGTNNNQNNSLFNIQNKPNNSLFGGNNAGANTSLFNGNNANAGNSLFGGSTNQNSNSMFNNSQSQPQQNQLTASITGDPYGNAQLFASLAAPSPPVGPLATPLSGAKPAPKARASLLASVRGGSPMLGASTSLTPRGRPGYGFSYSNYNSPAASTPVLTPGASSLLRPTGSMGSSLSSRLSKSFSTSNLRGELSDGQSLVRTPAPGQPSLLLGSGSLGSGSVRRLKIDRSLRTDLFGDITPKKPTETPKEADKEPELRKRVSFDKSAEKDASASKPSAANALVVRDDDTTPQKAPEMTQIHNQSLSTVHEETTDKGPSPRKPVEPGDYFTEPPLKQVKGMSRGQLSSIKTFTVGRQGVGKVEFGRNGSVDLSTVPLDDICGKIVQLKPRSATVYEDDHDKPPVGRGLNVPSTIYLEQSWPRATRLSSASLQKSTAKDIDRHKARLKRVGGTTFLDYDDRTGVWSFTVEHFTTYELDDDEETSMQDTTNEVQQADNSSELSPPPQTADMNRSFGSDGNSFQSPDLGEQDDTFQFKFEKRSQQNTLSLPGGFEDSMANITYDHDDASADEMQEDDFNEAGGLGDAAISDPFMDIAGAVQSPSPDTLARHHQDLGEIDMDEDKELPGSFQADPDALKSILKPATFNDSLYGITDHLADLPWEDQLQRTLSPKKRDRQALRNAQILHADKTEPAPESILKRSLLSRSQLGQSYLATKSAKQQASAPEAQHTAAFTTSMDIMRSLWADEKQASSRMKPSIQKSKSSKRANDASTDIESEFHQSFKPTFTNHDTLVFAASSSTRKQPSDMSIPLQPVIGGHRDIKFYHAKSDEDDSIAVLGIQQDKENTDIEAVDMEVDDEEELSMPTVFTSNRILFREIAECVKGSSASSQHEKAIWSLCTVLFDPLEVCAADLIRGMDAGTVDELQNQIRKDAFLSMWTRLLKSPTEKQLFKAKSSEEKALLLLCIGDVLGASETLMKAKNPKLAILVSQLPGSNANREIMQEQIQVWRDRKDWSEFSDGQRALYSLLAGYTSLVSGVKGAAEDQTAEFCIGKKYGLSWQQCLALKIRFAGDEGFPQAISAYVADLESGKDTVAPTPWHGNADDAEDTLLSLLKVITEETTAEKVLDPIIVSGDAFHNRLTWQLATLLAARGVLQPSDDQMDSLTLDLATEQEGTGSYLDALWTLLHLNDNESRHTAIKAVLERNCSQIPDPAGDKEPGGFERLIDGLLIPASLVWSAKSLHAQGNLHDYVLQCQYLLQAATHDSYQEAHSVLCKHVGPTAVIEQHYEDLMHLLQQFWEIGDVHFQDWAIGGGLYSQLCDLLQAGQSGTKRKDVVTTLKKLDRSLEAQKEQGERGTTLEMRVARIEIRKIVNERVKQIEDADKWYSGGVKGPSRSNKGNAMLERYMRALGEVH